MKPTFHMPTQKQDGVSLKHGYCIRIENNTYSLYSGKVHKKTI